MWKDIKGYEGFYQVSNKGQIKSLKRWMVASERILTGSLPISGYPTVSLIKNRVDKKVKIHRLVALHFVDNPKMKPQINHKNGIKTDNHFLNLEWCTASENTRHAFDIGLISQKGESNNSSKLTKKEVVAIRNHNTNLITQERMAKIYNVSRSLIGLVVNRKRWSHLN